MNGDNGLSRTQFDVSDSYAIRVEVLIFRNGLGERIEGDQCAEEKQGNCACQIFHIRKLIVKISPLLALYLSKV